MFSELKYEEPKRWDLSLLASVTVHVVALLVLTWHTTPVLVVPSDVALGTPGSSGSVVYLAPTGVEKSQAPPELPKLKVHSEAAKVPTVPKQASLPHTDENENPAAQFDQTAQGGSIYGTRVPGAPLTGHEIIPALPQVFPDPAISRADLPPGVQGDVIVEVTIDEQGNVVGLKLVHGIGYGIEDRVLATLRQWHFRPASKDGVTIASQHIVTFHYPG